MIAIIRYPVISQFTLQIFCISILLSIAISLCSISQSRADWRTDIGTFRIGVVAEGTLDETYAKIEPFRLAIAEALGLNVEIFIAKNYRTLINAHVAARIEYAVYSATAYASVWKSCECVEPIVIPKSYDGAESYKSVIIASDDGPKKLTDLAGSKMAGLSKSSFAGYKFAVFELESNGVLLPEHIEFSDSGEDAISEFVSGKYNTLIGWSSLSGDPGAGYSSGTLKLIAEQNGGTSIPYKIIWKSSAIPHRPHVVRKNLAGEAKILLRNTLNAMFDSDPVAYDSIEPVFGGGFVVARHGQFLPILKYVDSLVPIKEKSASSVRKETNQ
ncbi:MAG: PhnD/SsuA/transferrin family substrate-binding protein [Hyphomicrobiales bacterium]|nr:PhnD/SsuA/transferrin family substrate-binding protein [Hyphomicrobiales bacterium]